MTDKLFPFRVRIREITTVLKWRHGRGLPDDDAGLEYLSLVFDHYANLADSRRCCANFASVWAPWIGADRLEAMIEASTGAPRRWSADDLGRALNLFEVERHELRITTIAPADLTPDERASLRRQRRAEAARARRKRERERKERLRAAKRGVCEVSDRQAAILRYLTETPGWHTAAELQAALAWCDRRGRPLGSETLRRLINREFNALIGLGSIEVKSTTTKWGQAARKVRLAGDCANARLRENVPGTPGQTDAEL